MSEQPMTRERALRVVDQWFVPKKQGGPTSLEREHAAKALAALTRANSPEGGDLAALRTKVDQWLDGHMEPEARTALVMVLEWIDETPTLAPSPAPGPDDIITGDQARRLGHGALIELDDAPGAYRWRTAAGWVDVDGPTTLGPGPYRIHHRPGSATSPAPEGGDLTAMTGGHAPPSLWWHPHFGVLARGVYRPDAFFALGMGEGPITTYDRLPAGSVAYPAPSAAAPPQENRSECLENQDGVRRHRWDGERCGNCDAPRWVAPADPQAEGADAGSLIAIVDGIVRQLGDRGQHQNALVNLVHLRTRLALIRNAPDTVTLDAIRELLNMRASSTTHEVVHAARWWIAANIRPERTLTVGEVVHTAEELDRRATVGTIVEEYDPVGAVAVKIDDTRWALVGTGSDRGLAAVDFPVTVVRPGGDQ